MTLIKYKPESRRLDNPLFSDFFNRFFGEPVNEQENTSVSRFNPSVDIVEDDKSFELYLAVPGVKKSDFTIDVNEDRITVKGERKLNPEKEGKNFHSIQTQYGIFEKSFYLPESINRDKIEAEYKDGILSITIPKDEKKVDKKSIVVK